MDFTIPDDLLELKERTERFVRDEITPRENDKRLTPLLTFDPKGGIETVVAWATERQDGGRGFGFTEGHYHSNWQIEPYRRFVLNGIVWTAKLEIPEGGVKSTPPKE